MLHEQEGQIEFLEFLSNSTFRWTSSADDGRRSAERYYQNVEGIVQHSGQLFFVSKRQKELFTLDLDRMTYKVATTNVGQLPGGGDFANQPDQLLWRSAGLLFFTEDAGKQSEFAGVFALDGNSWRAVLEANDASYYAGETVGVDFSPSGMILFFACQKRGDLFQVRRVDGLPFGDTRRVLKWKHDLGR